MGGRVAQLILKFPIGGDLTKISESWAWYGRTGVFGLFVCFDLLGFVLYGWVNNFSFMSGWVYLGGFSTKQWVKCLFALLFFVPVNHFQSCRDDFLSFCFIPATVSFSRKQHSDSAVYESQTSNPSILTLYHPSHCAPHRHEGFGKHCHHNSFYLTWKTKRDRQTSYCTVIWSNLFIHKRTASVQSDQFLYCLPFTQWHSSVHHRPT